MKIENKEQKEQGKGKNLNWAPWTCKHEAPIIKTNISNTKTKNKEK